jgi:uncharacterized protein YbaR (Trm112 family)
VFIELVDALRCPVNHEDTWLVAAVGRFHGRHVAEGSLGCPVCRAQYRVEQGAVWFAAPPDARVVAALPPDEQEVLRARALLSLGDAGGVFALVGAAARFADVLQERSEATLVLVNPEGVEQSPGMSTLWVDHHVPIAKGTLHGALVEGAPAAAMLESLAVAIRAGGRLVAPAASAVPHGVAVLARDGREWVAERQAGASRSAPVTLTRGRPTGPRR